MSKENKGREWTVKGGKLMSGVIVIHCDGPVPDVNENIKVVEKAAFKKCQAENKQLRQQLAEREMEIEEFEGLREVSGKNRAKVKSLEQRLAGAEKVLDHANKLIQGTADSPMQLKKWRAVLENFKTSLADGGKDD